MAGAPEAADPEAWIDLVASNASDALKAQLRAYRARAGDEDGAAGGSPADTTARVAALRAELQRRGLAGFIVPRADEHQGEYVSPRAERLAWLTGFTGSAGLAIVLPQAAAIFVDGRYTLQVTQQVDTAPCSSPAISRTSRPRPGSRRTCPRAASSAMTPGCIRRTVSNSLRRAAARAGGELVACADNPLDAVWTRSAGAADRPGPAPRAALHRVANRSTSAQAWGPSWLRTRSMPPC